MHSGAESLCAVHCKTVLAMHRIEADLGTAGLARTDEMCCSRLGTEYTAALCKSGADASLAQDEAAMLRRALNESMRRVESLSDEGLVQVDRRIVVKLLVTFFEKGQSQEVLSLMARILAFTGQFLQPSCFFSLCRSARYMTLAHCCLFGRIWTVLK